MAIAEVAVFAAVILYLLTIAPVKALGYRAFDNANPRDPAFYNSGIASRALGAHINGIETLPFFAVSVLFVEFRAQPQFLVDLMAWYLFAKVASRLDARGLFGRQNPSGAHRLLMPQSVLMGSTCEPVTHPTLASLQRRRAFRAPSLTPTDQPPKLLPKVSAGLDSDRTSGCRKIQYFRGFCHFPIFSDRWRTMNWWARSPSHSDHKRLIS
jgi:uncharacterized MAPEG superfamily protein